VKVRATKDETREGGEDTYRTATGQRMFWGERLNGVVWTQEGKFREKISPKGVDLSQRGRRGHSLGRVTKEPVEDTIRALRFGGRRESGGRVRGKSF